MSAFTIQPQRSFRQGFPPFLLFCAPNYEEPLYPVSRKELISSVKVDGNAQLCFVIIWHANILEVKFKKGNENILIFLRTNVQFMFN